MSSATSSASTLLLSRRTFLRASTTAAGGLVVALYLDVLSKAQEPAQVKPLIYRPDAFIQIQPDGKVVIQVNRLEFGQGVHTALPMLLADEMDADGRRWSRSSRRLPRSIKTRSTEYRWSVAPGSVAHSFQQYRELGARTRAMLVSAAANRWKVSADQCRTEASVVRGPSGQKATYAELASDASRLPVPATAQLKNSGRFPSRRKEGAPVSTAAPSAMARRSSDSTSIWPA